MGHTAPAFNHTVWQSDKPADLTETEDASKPKEEVKHEAEIIERETVIESLSLSDESEPTTVSKEEVTVELQQEEERPKPDTDFIHSLEIQKDIKESEVVQKELSIQVEPSVEEHREVQADLTETEDASKPKEEVKHEAEITEQETVIESLSLSVESQPTTVSKEEVTVELEQEEERPKPDTDSIQSLEIQKDIKESEVVQKELSIQVEPSVEEHWEVQGKGKRRRKKVTKVEKTVIATEYQETGVTSPLEGYTSETKTEFEIEDIDDTLSPTEEELKPQEEMAGTATITTETTEEKQAVLEAESFSPYFTKPIIGVTLIEERISISDGNIIGKKLNVSEGNNKSNTGANFTFQEGPSINFEVEVLKETCDPVSDNNECEVSTTKVQQQSEFLCAEALSGVTSPGPPSTISVKVLEERIYTPDEDIKGSKQSFLSLYDVNTTEGPQETIRELQLLKKDKSVVMYESIPFEETLLEKDTSVLTCDSTEQMLNSYKIDTAKQVEQSFRTVAVNLKEEKKDIDLPKMGDRIHINLDDSGISFDPLKYSVSVIEENIYIEDEGNSDNNLDLECFDTLNYTLESSFKTIGRETDSVKEIMQTKASKSDDGTATFQEDIISAQDGGTDKIKEAMEDNDLQQHSSVGKSRSLFKLPSFKLPSLSFRRKKESANDPLDETIKDLNADLPHKDFATDLFNESEKLKTQLEIEAGKEKAPLLSKEGEHLKFQLPQLELSKLSTGEITESTGTSTDSLKVIVTKDNMTKTVDTQKEKSQLIKDMSPVNLLSESQPTTISVDSHLEEDIKIEFPYFMAPQISFVDPNDVQSDNAKFYKPVEQMEHGNSQSASEELQTHFIKKQKVNRFGHSGEITDDQFFTEKKKHSVSVSLRNVNLSEKKMKPNRSGFKLSFSKVKKPILPSEPQCESFGIAAHLEKVGIDLAEYDLTCEDELQTVDISCIANTSTLDLNKHQSDVKDADTGPDFGDETSLNEIKKSMKKEMNITPTAVKYITLNEKSSVTAKQFDTDYGLPNFTSHVSSDLPVSTESTEITIIKGSNKLDEVYSNTIWETKQNTAIDYTSDGTTQTKQPSTENMLLPTQIVKEYEISSSETEKPSFGFSLMKIKLPESHRNVNREESQISAEACTNTEDHLVVSENTKSLDIVLDNTTAEHKPNRQIFYIPKVKTLTLSVKSCDQPEFSNMSEYAETNDGAAKNEMSSTAAPSHDENSLKSKEATSNQSLKFRFHLPSIGFTSSVNKTDNETSIQKVQDTKKIEKEELQTSEKKSWFKVPKLGFSSATEKHLIDKTEKDDPELLAETTEDNFTKESKEKDKGEDSS
ncbi:myosin-11-like [Xenopus laevis]|uniref:Myosin-11-like n=1 Tax=Xenopus laevis TaxID=8355 RepID=A0A8J1LNG6_XENLA|nr:myosin-11-like [Xenopus laevis]